MESRQRPFFSRQSLYRDHLHGIRLGCGSTAHVVLPHLCPSTLRGSRDGLVTFHSRRRRVSRPRLVEQNLKLDFFFFPRGSRAFFFSCPRQQCLCASRWVVCCLLLLHPYCPGTPDSDQLSYHMYGEICPTLFIRNACKMKICKLNPLTSDSVPRLVRLWCRVGESFTSLCLGPHPRTTAFPLSQQTNSRSNIHPSHQFRKHFSRTTFEESYSVAIACRIRVAGQPEGGCLVVPPFEKVLRVSGR